MKNRKEILKIAISLHKALATLEYQWLDALLDKLLIFKTKVNELGIHSTKFKKALDKEWFMAAESLKERINDAFNDIAYTTQLLRENLDCFNKPTPSLSTLIAEIEQIEKDCGNLCYDREQNTISLQTESVYLEDFYLGPFKIELHLNKISELYKDSPYYCIALDPQYPANSEEVTHPHVSNDRLCEGDGSAIIRAALEEGRLCDFFCIVINILKTYNPHSPYVSLNGWSGVECYDCGYICANDSYYYCSSCENDFCDSCSSYCRVCDEIICLRCGGQCPHCGDFVCPNCISECSLCGSQCCQVCLEEDLCPTCFELERENNNDKPEEKIQTIDEANKEIETKQNSEEILREANTTIQPDSMGQTIVFSGQDRQ